MRLEYLIVATLATHISADICAGLCLAGYQVCGMAPDANQSLCASNYATCLGFAPVDSSGSVTTATACSGTAVVTATTALRVASPTLADMCAEGCLIQKADCDTEPNANHAVCAGNYAKCVNFAPTDSAGAVTIATSCASNSVTSSYPTATTLADTCANKCYQAYRACTGGVRPNFSLCTSQYAGCLGYPPYDAAGNFITAPVCSGTAAATAPTAAASGSMTTAAAGTVTQTTASPTTSGPVGFTGAAQAIKPAAGLMALGALAFL